MQRKVLKRMKNKMPKKRKRRPFDTPSSAKAPENYSGRVRGR